MIYAEIGAKAFQYIAPIVFGMISEINKIAKVRTIET